MWGQPSLAPLRLNGSEGYAFRSDPVRLAPLLPVAKVGQAYFLFLTPIWKLEWQSTQPKKRTVIQPYFWQDDYSTFF